MPIGPAGTRDAIGKWEISAKPRHQLLEAHLVPLGYLSDARQALHCLENASLYASVRVAPGDHESDEHGGMVTKNLWAG